jgi:hypothetical protein
LREKKRTQSCPKNLIYISKQLFAQFINTPGDKYLVTITAQTPEILSLPWELLHDAGQFLFAFSAFNYDFTARVNMNVELLNNSVVFPEICVKNYVI